MLLPDYWTALIVKSSLMVQTDGKLPSLKGNAELESQLEEHLSIQLLKAFDLQKQQFLASLNTTGQ